MKDPLEVKEAINDRVDRLFCSTSGGSFCPYVCIVCDVLLKPTQVKTISIEKLLESRKLLTPRKWNAIPKEVSACYKYTGIAEHRLSKCKQKKILAMLLSPRAPFLHSLGTGNHSGLCICRCCKKALNAKCMPEFAISNNYAFGTPPAELTDLTEVELALLTPVKCYGYVFAYTGGRNRQLEGSLSYYKVNMKSIVRGVAHFESLGLTNNVAVMLYGKMTPQQRAIARKKNVIRPDKVKKALEFLLQHNRYWKETNLNVHEVAQTLTNPEIVDHSSEVEEMNRNVETSESIKVFFPDGSMDTIKGGQNNMKEYKELVQKAKLSGINIEVNFDLIREATREYQDNNFANSCLLQFPFGYGGLQEERKDKDGIITDNVDHRKYIQHLSRLSQPQFHRGLFCLKLFNFTMKQQMVMTAAWKVRQKGNTEAFARHMTREEVSEALNRKEAGIRRGQSCGGQFVSAIDVVARSLPHTNEAAKKARMEGEALRHKFGMPHFFFTVTPDDENSFLMEVLVGKDIGQGICPTQLTEEQLMENSKQRWKIRIEYPGLCAFYYECMMDIIIEEVLQWDPVKQKSKGVGLFGRVEAFTATTEEQGRTTLHTHFQIWTKGLGNELKKLHSRNPTDCQNAKINLCSLVDKISSCSLLGHDRVSEFMNKQAVTSWLDHICNVCADRRSLPKIADPQQLRNLRHRIGCKRTQERFVDCSGCMLYWSDQSFLTAFLRELLSLRSISLLSREANLLKAMCVHYQREPINPYESFQIETAIDAAYNHHMHTKSSCFNRAKKNKSKRKRVYSNEECRYRYPKRAKLETSIEDATAIPVKWYNPTGSFKLLSPKEVCLKRDPYDAFQNNSCPAVSLSKMTCNTNLSLLMTGTTGEYSFKYCLKNTQEDDTERFEKVRKTMEKVLSKTNGARSDKSIAISRLLAASFAHQRTNVLGAALGAYLTRMPSRFRMSHTTVWCPLRDVISLLDNEDLHMQLEHHANTSFFVNSAFHYLCRPTELESVCLYEFTAGYHVVKHYKKQKKEGLLFFSNEVYQHPSFNQKTNRFHQAVRERAIPVVPKVFQYDFPDTAKFGGSIMKKGIYESPVMDDYARRALSLFIPHRRSSDLQIQGSHVKKYRQALKTKAITPRYLRILQNIQDAKANALRFKIQTDDLEKDTVSFSMDRNHIIYEDIVEEEEVEEGNTTDETLNEIFELWDQEMTNQSNSGGHEEIPDNFCLKYLKNKGSLQSGYRNIACMITKNMLSMGDNLIEFANNDEQDYEDLDKGNQYEPNDEIPKLKKKELCHVLFTRTKRRTLKVASFKNQCFPLREANGTVESILDWSETLFHNDTAQKRAFEIIVGSFVLTYFTEEQIANDKQITSSQERLFQQQLRNIRKLTEATKRKSDQLICLLHGPGGCGKSTVLDIVMLYARNFCDNINQNFSSRTIVVTALTGVAATLLLGDTVHSGVYLNQKKPIDTEQIEAWNDTRMLIVDEISFAGKDVFQQLHVNLCVLKQEMNSKYGNLNIVFSGDFRQLEPVGEGTKAIYKSSCPEFVQWINCFIEMNGLHRFSEDPQWGKLLRRFRDGTVTREDIIRINSRVVADTTRPPDNIRYATYANKERDSINTALFEKFCNDMIRIHGHTRNCVIVFSDCLRIRTSTRRYVKFSNHKVFWENCGEDDVKMPGRNGRMDPVLLLYKGCNVMLTTNTDVKNGIANGTTALFEKLTLKRGATVKNVRLTRDITVLVATIGHGPSGL